MFRFLCVALLLAVPAFSQYGGSSRGTMPRQSRQKAGPGQTTDLVLPTFTGTVSSISSKRFSIQESETNELEFHLTRKTAFLDGKDKIKPADIQKGDRVSVEAKRAPDQTMDAVVVRVERSKAKNGVPLSAPPDIH
jgi:hypothetical protein